MAGTFGAVLSVGGVIQQQVYKKRAADSRVLFFCGCEAEVIRKRLKFFFSYVIIAADGSSS